MSDPWGQPQQQSGDWSMPQEGGQQQQSTFAPPPVDNSGQFGTSQAQYQQGGPQQTGYGAQQPGYAAPQQSGYGVPQQGYGAPQQGGYGAPQADFGGQQPYGQQAPYGYPVQPEKQGNGFAVAGFILSLLPLLGLIFSILGLVRSGKAGGKGKGLSIAGIILSIALGIGYSVGIAHLANSATALDPGCTSAESKFTTLDSQMTSDQGNVNAMLTDLNTMQQTLQDSANQATHASVKSKLQAASTDLATTITDLKAAQAGTLTDTTKLDNDIQQFETDGTALDTLCSTF